MVEISLIISVLSLLISLGCAFFIFKMYTSFSKLFGRVGLKDELADNLSNFNKDTKQALKSFTELQSKVESLEKENDLSFNAFAIKRFNPYEEAGGDLSFCIAIINKQKNGFMLTSLHGRERTRIYTRNIIDGNINSELLFDEKETLNETLQKI